MKVPNPPEAADTKQGAPEVHPMGYAVDPSARGSFRNSIQSGWEPILTLRVFYVCLMVGTTRRSATWGGGSADCGSRALSAWWPATSRVVTVAWRGQAETASTGSQRRQRAETARRGHRRRQSAETPGKDGNPRGNRYRHAAAANLPSLSGYERSTVRIPGLGDGAQAQNLSAPILPKISPLEDIHKKKSFSSGA